MSAPQTYQLHRGGVALVGDEWRPPGEDRGAVLLLHGGGQRRHSWRRTGERLTKLGWRAYALDSRGHGDSGWAPNGDYSVTALVDDLAAVVNDLNEQPVVVGASMGGLTALIGQGERGDLARALVLVDVVARMEPVGVERVHSFMTSAPRGFASLEEAAEAIAAYNPRRSRSVNPEGLRKNLRQGKDGRWHWHWDPVLVRRGNDPEHLNQLHERAREAARHVDVPTLIIRGAESDVVSDAGSAEMLDLIPHARELQIPSTGHMVAGDDNDVFTTELEHFLSQV